VVVVGPVVVVATVEVVDSEATEQPASMVRTTTTDAGPLNQVCCHPPRHLIQGGYGTCTKSGLAKHSTQSSRSCVI
jgi:hypothetical protein